MSNLAFVEKIDNLYKYIAEGWSVSISETKSGLFNSKDYLLYKESEHFERVRTIYKGRKKQKTAAYTN